MAERQKYYLKFDGNLNLFELDGGNVNDFVSVPEFFFDTLNDSSDFKEININDFLCRMSVGQVLETYDKLIVKTYDGFLHIKKRDIYAEAIDVLVSEIDIIQQVNQFLMMDKEEQRFLKLLLCDLFCVSKIIPERITLPIFAAMDYCNLDCDPNEVLQYITLNVNTDKWHEALHGILNKIPSIKNDTSLCYSHIVKYIIQQKL